LDQETSLSETGDGSAGSAPAGGADAGSLASAVGLEGPLAFADVLTLGADIARELADREDTAGHGGVQPETIVRQADGPWVLTAAGFAVDGEPALAPELAAAGPDAAPTAAGDVYALGATLVYALTGQAFVDGALGGDEPTAGGPEGSDGTDDPAAGEPADGSAGGPAEVAAPQSLPDVMAAFLDTLRRTLASDPAVRVTAVELAGTLRQLRSDVDRLTAPVAPVASAVTIGPAAGGSAMAAGAVGGAVAGAALADVAAAEGAGAAADAAVDPVTGALLPAPPAEEKPPTTLKQRLPVLVAAAAIIVAIVAVGLLLKKDDKGVVAAGPSTSITTVPPTTRGPLIVPMVGTEVTTTTSSTTTTTTKKVTTTTAAPIAPPPTAPPVTQPPAGTQAVTVDMSHMTNCPGCLASLRTQPQLLSQLTAQFPDKTALWGQCWTTGDKAHDDQGFTSDQWIFIVGPASQGWIPIHLAGRQTYGLPACPQSPTTAPPTTAPPTTPPPTTPTTPAPTTTTTTTVPKP
jgi:hypothetical protein